MGDGGVRQRKHERIAEELRVQIRTGQLTDGDRLPGENALMEMYGVARMTARQALADLQNEGLAVARKGSGVYVRTFRPVRRFGAQRLSKEVWGAGRSVWDADTSSAPPVVDSLTVTTEPAPEVPARMLTLSTDDRVVVRSRRYSINGEPVQLATAYIPAVLAEGTPIAEENTGPGGVFARLADLGHAPVRFTEEVYARMPTPQESDELRLTTGTPVICVARTAFAAGDRPVEFSEMTLSSTAYVLSYDFQA